MNRILSRFREPSTIRQDCRIGRTAGAPEGRRPGMAAVTWGGFAVLLALFGLSHDQAQAVTELLAAAAATASVFLPEQGGNP